MKHLNLFLQRMLAFLFLGVAFSINVLAQEEVTVGTGTYTTSAAPVYSGWYYSTSQCIYSATEIGNAGKIYSLAYYIYSTSNTPVKIYMGHKSGNTFSSSSDYLTETEFTLVYTGNIGQTSGWETKILDTPFEYNGVDNLVIAVCKYSSTNNAPTVYATSKNSTTLYRRSDGTSGYGSITYTGNYSFSDYRPNIKLGIESGKEIGTGTTASNVLPYCNANNYSTVQSLYTPTEVGGAGTINKIAYNVATAGSYTPSAVNIYMGHKSSTFSSKSDNLTASDLTLVYTGKPTLGAKTGWEDISLTVPFNYNGMDNLVIVVCKQGATVNSTLKYNSSSTATSNYCLTRKNNSTAAYGLITGTNAYAVSSTRPNIKISMKQTDNTQSVTVGTSTSYTTVSPYCCDRGYSTTQFIYTASEVGDAGKIKKIAYNVASSGSYSPSNIKIYMGHKSSLFSSSSDYMTSSNLTLVYDGAPQLGNTTGWENITLDTPFEFDGSRNLVVVVCKQSGNTSSTPSYYYTSTSTGSGYYGLTRSSSTSGYGVITNTSYSYSTTSYRPNIKFTKEATQTTSSIGSASNTGNYPYYNNYYYSTNQLCYTPSEVGGSGTIQSIAFRVASNYTAYPNSVKIYMGHKSSNFSSSSDYLPIEKLTLVYSGAPTLGYNSGWENISLTTPFIYNGTDNLIIVVCKQASSTYSTSYYYTSKSSGSGYYGLYRYSNSYSAYSKADDYSYSYSTSNNRPDIQIKKNNVAYTITTATGSSSVSVQGKPMDIFEDWTSTNKTASSTSSKDYTINASAGDVLTFEWETSSELDADKLNIKLDGATIVANKSGNGTKGTISQTLTNGAHTLSMSYTKDDSKNQYNDEVYVRNIKLTYASPKLSFQTMDLNDATTTALKVYNKFYVDKLRYVRSYANTNWQALYVPFSMAYANWSANFDVAKINDVHMYDRNDDGTIDDIEVEIIKVTSGNLLPNHPYLIRAKATGSKTITLTNAAVYTSDENIIDCSSIEMKHTFAGSYNTIAKAVLNTAGAHVLSNGSLVNSTSDLTPFRWYLTSQSRSGQISDVALSRIRVRCIDEDDFTTDIENIEDSVEEITIDAYYTLDGIRLDQPRKGANIVKFSDGSKKKIFVK